MKFTENSVIFEDDSEQQIDVVIFATGYTYKFPFFKDDSLVKISDDGQTFRPLYKRVFYINDPSLMFFGNIGGPLQFQSLERWILMAKYFVMDQCKLPEPDVMIAEEESFIESVGGVYNYFRAPPSVDLKYYEDIHKMLKSSGADVPPLNRDFIMSICKLWDVFIASLMSGDFKDFKSPNCEGYDIMDTMDLF